MYTQLKPPPPNCTHGIVWVMSKGGYVQGVYQGGLCLAILPMC